jgi:predicted nucleic acid-binding protein
LAVILDTNALSAFADGDAQLLRVIGKETDLALPVVALGEYLYGVHQSRQRARYERWVSATLPLFDVLPVGENTARHYAEIRGELKAAGRPIPSNDLWIAALARQHRLPVLSRDRHFQAVTGLRLVTW